MNQNVLQAQGLKEIGPSPSSKIREKVEESFKNLYANYSPILVLDYFMELLFHVIKGNIIKKILNWSKGILVLSFNTVQGYLLSLVKISFTFVLR